MYRSWAPPPGSVEVLAEPGVFEAPDGGVYVSPEVWAEWTYVDPEDVRCRDMARRRWLEHHGWRKPTMAELKTWNHNLWERNEALIAERDALRLALLGVGGTAELQAINKDGIAT